MSFSDSLVPDAVQSKVTVLRSDQFEILSQAVVEICSMGSLSTLQTNQGPLMHGLEPILQRGQFILKSKELVRKIESQHLNRTLHRISMVHNTGEMFPCTYDIALTAGSKRKIVR